MSRPTIKRVPTKLCRVDLTIYPRTATDWRTVLQYADAMRAGAAFPPIIVVPDGDSFLVLDGAHRLGAARELKATSIPAEVRDVPPSRRYVEAFRLNSLDRARPLTPYEKTLGFLRMREEGLTFSEIEKITLTPTSTIKRFLADRVVQIRPDRLERGRGSTRLVIKAPLRHLGGAGNGAAHDTGRRQRHLAVMNQVALLDQVIDLLSGEGMIDAQDSEVAERLVRIAALLAPLVSVPEEKKAKAKARARR